MSRLKNQDAIIFANENEMKIKPLWKKEAKELIWEIHDLPCMLLRDPVSQAWQGYVGVHRDSILYGLAPLDIAPYKGDWGAPLAEFARVGDFDMLHRAMALPASDPSTDGYAGNYNAPVFAMFKVHGGLRFAGMPWAGLRQWSTGAPWFFGFHCHHEYDISPASYRDEENYALPSEPDPVQRHMDLMGSTVYRTFDYAKTQTENLAAQIAAYHEWVREECPPSGYVGSYLDA